MRSWLRTLLIVFIAVGVTLGWSRPEPHGFAETVSAQEQPAPAVEPDKRLLNTVQDFNQIFSDVAERALPSVVTILASRVVQQQAVPDSPYVEGEPSEPDAGEDPQRFFRRPPQRTPRQGIYQRALGSGVIVREDGIILTNHHVIDKADEIKVRLHDHREVDARVLGTDPKSDLAVVKIEARGLQPGTMGDSDALRIGEWVLCVGSPLSETLEYSVTAGIVSAKSRSNVGLADYEDYIQTDAAINPGNSGGPMLNLKGQIVGINTAIASQTGGYQGVSFAVPSSMAKSIMRQLLEHGKVTRGWLGVMIQNLDDNLVQAFALPSRNGVLVGDVVDGSPAAEAGLKVGDVLLSMDGQRLEDVSAVRNRVANLKPGTRVQIEALRSGRKLGLQIEIVELEEDVPEEASGEVVSVKDLGLEAQAFTPALAERLGLPETSEGIVVVGIEEGSVAWEAGLREGDLLRSASRVPLTAPADLEAVLQKLKPGAPVLLFVERQDGTLFLAFKRPGA